MYLRNRKLFIGVCILLAYISIGVFGLLKLDHKIEMPMDNCPYAQNSYAICENSLDHINNWQQFLNAISPSLFIFSILILGIVLYLVTKHNFLNQKSYFYKWKYCLYNKKLYPYSNIIIKWLAFFENSPSFFYRA